jgi:hypothetical protein
MTQRMHNGSESCSQRITPEVPRRRGNALNIEVGTPLPRCKLKLPAHWHGSGVSAARWLMSGGDPLVFGICTSPCPEGIITRPCIGCGYCCTKATCAIGVAYYDLEATDRCPGLRVVDGTYRCALADQYGDELAIGAGCCSPLNSERQARLQSKRGANNS